MIRTMLSLTVLAALAGVPAAQEMHALDTTSSAVAPDTTKGTIEKVDREGGTFTLKVGERTETVSVNKATVYTLDGKESTRDLVLKVGAEVTVTHSGGSASRVEAVTPKA